MHSLKPTGSNIAQEFYNLMNKKGLDKTAERKPDVSEDVSEEGFDALLESFVGKDPNDAVMQIAKNVSEADDEAADQVVDAAYSEDSITDMITDEADDKGGMQAAMGLIDDAVRANSAGDQLLMSASEKRVLDGLSKIASGLRSKGEGFAADVVLSTANSIRGDIEKNASRKNSILSGLEKIASDMYSNGEQLAGDMVQVTIGKISSNS